MFDYFTLPKHHHDIADGYIKNCQVCGSDNLELIIELGHQPLCDSLLSKEQLFEPEEIYPLNFWRCKQCSLTQIDYAVKSDVVYHKDYPYRSGITKEVVSHMHDLSTNAIEKLQLQENSFIVDIGSNDGTLLKSFKTHNMNVCGIEPTNIAKLAIADGVNTYQDFFNEDTAKRIIESYGQCHLLTATNVFAHMSNLGQVLRGAEKIVKNEGFFIVEAHYLINILKNAQYDSIYHEHLRTYSLKSLIILLSMYGFTIFDAEVTERYSGTLRIYACKSKQVKINPSVQYLLQQEDSFGIYHAEIYHHFATRVKKSKLELLNLALYTNSNHYSFVGNSCPGRCSTLLNYVGISKDLMPYICEQPTSLKLDMYLPGKHIPIINNKKLIEDQPDYIVLLAWHYADSIIKELREKGIKSKLVLPLPEVRIIEDAQYTKKSQLTNVSESLING